MNMVWTITSTVLSVIVLLLQEWRLLLYFQQEEYSSLRFIRWVIRNAISIYWYALLLLVAAWLLVTLALPEGNTWTIYVRIIALFVIGVSFYISIVRPKKIKLAYTPRLWRLIVALVVLTITTKWASDTLAGMNLPSSGTRLLLCDIAFILLCPLIIVLANLLLSPVEQGINRYYLRMARKKIEQLSPLVIGITGSYGKTSTKDILAHILEGYKSVLATPKSYNTLLGVAKVVNGSLLRSHELFIVEMGAYTTSEIENISHLVKPSIGIITAIGPQHLERFRSIENIAQAKFELIKSLPSSGLAVFNADDKFTPFFLQQLTNQIPLLVSTMGHPDAQIIASDIKATENGIEFWVENRTTCERVLFFTGLFGYHNVLNILLTSAVAQHLGMELRAIADRVKVLKPVTHRLQLIKLPKGINIIDDAYNSNPVGARNALDALSLFPGRKILITPGFVELGELQENENYKLGEYASKICDLVILTGKKQTQAICNGLVENGFDMANIKVVNSTQEGIEFINSVTQPGDTALYLNDLPDLYSVTI